MTTLAPVVSLVAQVYPIRSASITDLFNRFICGPKKCAKLHQIDPWEDEDYAKSVLSTNKRFTSKNEVLIREYFINTYPNDEWTFGGGIKINGQQISRDLYSNKLKICFEYDGIWHFKDIYGQLNKKKLKDSLLEQWCLDNKYSLIRLDEDHFNNQSLTILEKIFYSLNEPSIIKIGNRY